MNTPASSSDLTILRHPYPRLCSRNTSLKAHCGMLVGRPVTFLACIVTCLTMSSQPDRYISWLSPTKNRRYLGLLCSPKESPVQKRVSKWLATRINKASGIFPEALFMSRFW